VPSEEEQLLQRALDRVKEYWSARGDDAAVAELDSETDSLMETLWAADIVNPIVPMIWAARSSALSDLAGMRYWLARTGAEGAKGPNVIGSLISVLMSEDTDQAGDALDLLWRRIDSPRSTTSDPIIQLVRFDDAATGRMLFDDRRLDENDFDCEAFRVWVLSRSRPAPGGDGRILALVARCDDVRRICQIAPLIVAAARGSRAASTAMLELVVLNDKLVLADLDSRGLSALLVLVEGAPDHPLVGRLVERFSDETGAPLGTVAQALGLAAIEADAHRASASISEYAFRRTGDLECGIRAIERHNVTRPDRAIELFRIIDVEAWFAADPNRLTSALSMAAMRISDQHQRDFLYNLAHRLGLASETADGTSIDEWERERVQVELMLRDWQSGRIAEAQARGREFSLVRRQGAYPASLLCEAQLELGRFTEALEIAKEMSRAYPGHPLAALKESQILIWMLQEERAAKVARDSVSDWMTARNPHHLLYIPELMKISARADNHDWALTQIDHLLTLDDSKQIHSELREVRLDLERNSEQ